MKKGFGGTKPEITILDIRDSIRPHSGRVRELALDELPPKLLNEYIGALDAKDLGNISERELFLLMRSLKTGTTAMQGEIAQEASKQGITDIVEQEARKISLYFERIGYSFMRDLEQYDKGTLNQVFEQLYRNNSLFTAHPIPYYMGTRAANIVLIRNSHNLHENVREYLDILVGLAQSKKSDSSTDNPLPVSITLQEATLHIMRHFGYTIPMRDGMIRAMVGLAYGGSPPLRRRDNDNPLTDLPFIEFAAGSWEKNIPYPNPNLNAPYQGPFWVLNQKDQVSGHLAQLRFQHLKVKEQKPYK
ncbi:hypothetical protein HYU09_00520 [Candidatus Woesearchaeota archaeon]|nr:hypothetical protein [Candidatus Woesearchaeota archaeon]